MSLGMRKVLLSRISAAMDGRIDHDLESSHPPLAVLARESSWRDHRLQIGRELHADLLLLRGGEGVDDPIHGARGAGRVQRRENKVARLRGGDRRLHRLQVAHFADENHVRVLPQRAPQALAKTSARPTPTSRWFTIPCLCSWKYSIGSSIVIDVRRAVLVDHVQHAASVVVLPEPVGPVTRISPRGMSSNCRTAGGRPICSRESIFLGIDAQRRCPVPLLAEDADAEAVLPAEGQAEIHAALFIDPLEIALAR